MRRAALCLCFALGACREKTEPERFANVRVSLPAFRDRTPQGSPASGSLERRDREGATAAIAWDADERGGPVTEIEALVGAGLGAGATAALAAAVAGHPALEVSSGGARTLLWRCDRTRRFFRLALNERAAARADLASLGASVGCHGAADKPVNGEVPVADIALLGGEWQFARRQPAAAAWLREDAVLTLFAGQRAPGPRDPESAQRLAPAWAQAAGLKDATALPAEWVAGPGRHQALRVQGRATLDGRAVRFTLLQWRCIARGRSFAALVFASEPAATTVRAAAPWTPHDEALLAARCHG